MLWKKQQNIDRSSSDEVLSPLTEPFRTALISMYAGEPQLGSDGERHKLDEKVRISRELGVWLYNLCRDAKPKATLEIGLAYGYSTVYFLAAIRDNGAGCHTAVDPYQSHWHGIGQLQAQSLSMGDNFRLIEEKSVPALAHLADRAETFEVTFIDGNHKFDDVLVDFTLSAELCPMGGFVILDDMWMPSIRQAVAFIRSNRHDFEEIKTPMSSIAAFRRIHADSREWDHYVEFPDTHGKPRIFRRFTPAFLRRGAKSIARFLGT
jgi:predicted O-methyltransferase YrrM